jgi:hypothetical protein
MWWEGFPCGSKALVDHLLAKEVVTEYKRPPISGRNLLTGCGILRQVRLIQKLQGYI